VSRRGAGFDGSGGGIYINNETLKAACGYPAGAG
jgi:hypothetical protein